MDENEEFLEFTNFGNFPDFCSIFARIFSFIEFLMGIDTKFEVLPETDEYGNIKYRGVGKIGRRLVFTNALYSKEESAERVIQQIIQLEKERMEMNSV